MIAPAILLATVVTLWHATDGAERAALEKTIALVNEEARGRYEVVPLQVPFESFARKLEVAIPSGEGPDLFLAAHDRLGDWARSGLIAPAPEESLDPATPATIRAGVSIERHPYAIPVGHKALLLYWNRDLLPEGPPARLDGIPALAQRLRPRGVFALAYDATNFFLQAPFFFAAGGKLFAPAEGGGERIAVFDQGKDLEQVLALKRAGAIPDEASSALATGLFNSGRAAIVVSGPWFAGDVSLPNERWDVAPLFEGMGSFVTVEGIFRSAQSRRPESNLAARAIARLWVKPALVRRDAIERAEQPATERGLVTPSRPEMSLIWEPAKDLLRNVLERGVPVEDALVRARHYLAVLSRPDPPPADPGPYYQLACGLLLVLALYAAWHAVRTSAFRRAFRRDSRFAYKIALPAALSILALVILPALAGALVSLFAYGSGGKLTFVGLQNFERILLSKDFAPLEPGSFVFTLGVTVLWTVANLLLHVTIGAGLALLLRRPWLALRGAYRILLVVPWAVPSYITALIWRGLFDRELGAINAILRALGHEPVGWFSHFATAFAANLATNAWLGFPFMMVVTLGALQGIPKDLEEVAELEGASRLQALRLVILPAIRPALVPAVVLGSIWTFNMFNVIYLVSGGEPGGSTEILISQSYKWAFVLEHRYGYAAAYAVLIFLILLIYSRAVVPREERALA